MSQYTPYNILHLQLTEVHNFAPPAKPAMVFLWANDIPLGHCWYTPHSAPSLHQLIIQSVANAIEYYQPGSSNFIKDTLGNNDTDALNTLLNKLSGKQILSTDEDKPVSVIICTRNRAPMLDLCLTSLSKASGTFEVIVVDNASYDDATRKVADKHAFCRYVSEPRKGLDIARNTGAKAAQYSIIAYTDDDVQLPADWVSKVSRCFADERTMAVTGQVFPLSLQTRSQYIFERYWGFNKGYVPTVFNHEYFLQHLPWGVPAWDIGAGANMAFRKDVFDLVGWFDERLDVGAAGCSGDSEFWYRILAEGWNCSYQPQLYVYHQHRDTRQALHNQVFSYMRGQVASLYVQHQRYGHAGNLLRINNILPRYYAKRVLKHLLFKREEGGTLLTEIRGYLSGRRYFKQHQQAVPLPPPPHPTSLMQPAVVTASTLVSVVITCYNYGHYLARAISSCLAQSYKHIQVIVVDDGSTDNTEEIARTFPGIIYTRVHRVGLSAARNIGVSFATGKYIMFLDADDHLYPNAVELGLYYFGHYPSSVFISGGHDKTDSTGVISEPEQPIHLHDCYQALLLGNYIGMEATVLYRRELFFSFHFDTSLDVCEDYDLNLRISRQYPAFSHNTKIAAYYQHNTNMSSDKNRMLHTAVSILTKLKKDTNSYDEKHNIEQGILNWEKYYLRHRY